MGMLISALAFNLFFDPYDVIPTGSSGLALLISRFVDIAVFFSCLIFFNMISTLGNSFSFIVIVSGTLSALTLIIPMNWFLVTIVSVSESILALITCFLNFDNNGNYKTADTSIGANADGYVECKNFNCTAIYNGREFKDSCK